MTQDPRHLYEREAIAQRYCEDCRWFSLGMSDAALSRCQHPDPKLERACVSREPISNRNFCEHERTNPTRCGPDARWFESKPASISEAAE